MQTPGGILPDADPLEAEPPVNRQSGVKTLPCPTLRLRAVKILLEH